MPDLHGIGAMYFLSERLHLQGGDRSRAFLLCRNWDRGALVGRAGLSSMFGILSPAASASDPDLMPNSSISPPLPVLRLKRGEDRRIRAGHLWVFSNEIDNAATPLVGFKAGTAVHIESDRQEFLGLAYVNPHALICARIVGRDPAQRLDRALISERLSVALALRARLGAARYGRLVFGESDA